MCGSDICIPYNKWCQSINYEEYSLSYIKYLKTCPELVRTYHSDRLCQNATFWKDRGDEERCTGNNPGQIKPPLEQSQGREPRAVFSVIPCSGVSETSSCRDNSNVVCDQNSDACTSNLTTYCDNSEICIHHSLECDGYIHCPDGSDEEETKCQACPRSFGYPTDKLKVAMSFVEWGSTARNLIAQQSIGQHFWQEINCATQNLSTARIK